MWLTCLKKSGSIVSSLRISSWLSVLAEEDDDEEEEEEEDDDDDGDDVVVECVVVCTASFSEWTWDCIFVESSNWPSAGIEMLISSSGGSADDEAGEEDDEVEESCACTCICDVYR